MEQYGRRAAHLADAAALVVVKSMASDAWTAMRGQLSRLFRHGSDTALDQDAELVAEADEAEREDVRAELAPLWRRRLLTLPRECPEEELDALLAQLRALVGETDTGAQTVTGSSAGRDIIQIDPTDRWALATRGQTHRWRGDLDAALADLDRAIDLGMVEGWVLAERGEVHRLLDDFDASLRLDPDDAWTIASRGQRHQQLGRYREALADLDRAVELDPDSGWIGAVRAEILALMGD